LKKLLIILLVASACSVANKKSRYKPLHFFACTHWTDYNNDGKYDYNEFENIRDSFNSNERVLFIGFFKDLPAGSMLRFRLYSPDGSLVHEEAQPQVFNVALLYYEYLVTDLISQSSPVIWEAVWDVENDVVADIEVKFVY